MHQALPLESRLTFGIYELDDDIILENVDFLNCRNSINSNSFQGALEPFVIRGSCLVHGLLLSAIECKRNLKMHVAGNNKLQAQPRASTKSRIK